MTPPDHIPATRASGNEIDSMEAFAEVPSVLPTFSTRFGPRMSYVDSKGKQRCLTLKVADLTRIMHSAAVALEAMTKP